MVTLHATCVVVSDLAVLLRGPSGGGKSDLALRLIDGGACLIADDQVKLRVVEPSAIHVTPSTSDGVGAASKPPANGQLLASCPAPLIGLLEVRGVGILPVPYQDEAVVELIVDLVDQRRAPRLTAKMPERLMPERLPAPDFATILSVTLPRLWLNPFEPSAAAKLRLAASALRAGQLGKLPAPAHLSDEAFCKDVQSATPTRRQSPDRPNPISP